MYYREVILAALLAVSVTACATAPVDSGGSTVLELRLAEQQELLNAANSRVDELSLKVQLLQEKLNPDVAGVSASAIPAAPPAGLSVVELKEDTSPVAVLPVVVLKGRPEKQKKALSLKISAEGGAKAENSKAEKKKGKKSRPKKDVAIKSISPKGLYSTGQNLFLEGRYKEAREAFGLFIGSYPKHSLADNALYWLGEADYSEKRYASALKSFLKIAEFYPNENKVPDALLKAGYSYIELDDYDNASRAFKRLVSSYPDSVAAGKADSTLRTLLSQKKEGPK